MQQGPSFRITTAKFPTKDPNHRIFASQKSRFTHDYFYIPALYGVFFVKGVPHGSYQFSAPVLFTSRSSRSRPCKAGQVRARFSRGPFL